MKRWCSTVAIAIAMSASVPVVAQPAERGAPPHACESAPNPGDSRRVTCPIVGSGAPRHFAFTVTFVGGHDDTRASMSMRLDGTPFDCEAGSKVSLYGEDGEVSLSCRLSLTAPPGSSHALVAEVVWTHAQYKDFALVER